MRVPFARVYRAFPELDRFSDAECERFVALAARRYKFANAVGAAAALTATAGGWAGMVGLWRIAGILLPKGWTEALEQREMGLAMWLIILVGSIAVGPVCGLMVRDKWLRWAVRRHIDSGRCPKCEYALLGLEARGEPGEYTVVCPECGEAVALKDLGMTPGELLARGQPAIIGTGGE